MKRGFDIVVSTIGLLASSPVMVPLCMVIWLQDRHSPFYIAPRVGRRGQAFRMVKLRSMVIRADRTGVDSTSGDDPRITPVGRFVRKFKLDEVPQLWNVLLGQMSLVGPRPNVEREVNLYTDVETGLLAVRPGITDFASIVFSDEGEILEGSEDPNIAYNQLIRPWKSWLGLFYIENRSFMLDLRLLWLTALSAVSRNAALKGVARQLERLEAPDDLRQLVKRTAPLVPLPPPGSEQLVMARV